MRVSLTDDKWPEYLPGQPDYILVVGVISLNYGRMENMFRYLFSIVTRMNEIQVAAIFERMPNNIRQTVLAEVMSQTTLPDKLKDRVKHFIDGFKICADNRHDLMHSRPGGTFTSQSRGIRGLLFTKFSKSGKELMCAPSLPELREVADDLHEYATFGGEVAGEVRNFLACREHDDEESFWRVPLKRKPRKPTALRWHSPNALIQPSPRRSSPE
jgi:hypothetical protein